MAFSTTSYLAGVGSVVVILSTGFAGGYMLANPTRQDPPNRLQRLAAEGQDSRGVRKRRPRRSPKSLPWPRRLRRPPRQFRNRQRPNQPPLQPRQRRPNRLAAPLRR